MFKVITPLVFGYVSGLNIRSNEMSDPVSITKSMQSQEAATDASRQLKDKKSKNKKGKNKKGTSKSAFIVNFYPIQDNGNCPQKSNLSMLFGQSKDSNSRLLKKKRNPRNPPKKRRNRHSKSQTHHPMKVERRTVNVVPFKMKL